MTGMVKNLLKAYAESIKKLDWMSENTKKALAKVDKFMIKIGYPDKWRDYSALKVAKMTCLEIQKELENLNTTEC
jgi:putative endopeptidase